MDFNSTPINVTELLIMAIGVLGMYFLFRQKTDSNFLLMYYIAMIIFMSMTDRDVTPYLFYFGMAVALLIRFEFMNAPVTKFVVGVEIIALFLILWTSLTHIFGPGIALF
ncbi:MAG: hypothetical protein ABI823_05270 [Bryobacteraceae bacterium]